MSSGHTPLGRRRVLMASGALASVAATGWSRAAATTTPPPDGLLVVDVRAQGATGDGTTDDTAAFQTAFGLVASAGGGIVWVPAGTYQTATLQLPASCLLLGEGLGSVLRPRSGSALTALIELTGRRIRVMHLALDATGATSLQGPLLSVHGNAFDIEMANVWCRSPNTPGIAIANAATAVRVDACTIDAPGSDGVTVVGASEVTIVRNLIVGCGGSAIRLGSSDAPTDAVHVWGNVVQDAGATGSNVAAIAVGPLCTSFAVSANVVATTAAGCPGITVSGAGTSARNGAVTGNVVANAGADGIHIDAPGVVVAANSIRNATGCGIATTATGQAIVANAITNAVAGSIGLSAPGGHLVVGNACWQDAGGSPTPGTATITSAIGVRPLLAGNVAGSATGVTAPVAAALDGGTSWCANGNAFPTISVSPTPQASGPGPLLAPTVRLGVVTVDDTGLALAHNLGRVPTTVVLDARSEGAVWVDAPADATSVYLRADAPGRTCEVRVA